MKGYTKRKAISGQRATRVTISVDAVTNTAVRTLMAREALTYSAGICSLATSAAINDPALLEAIKVAVFEGVRANLKETGYHEGLAHALASNLTSAPRVGVVDDRI